MIGGAKGIGIGLDFGIGNQSRPKRTEKPYIEPDVLASLCGVWIADQNTNESPTRNIIKNKLKDRGGDFEILNAAYAGNSGYGLYKEDFIQDWFTYDGVDLFYDSIRLTKYWKDTVWIANKLVNNKQSTCVVNITGMPENGVLIITNPWTILNNGLNEIIINGIESDFIGFRIAEESINLDWSNLVIKQIPEHKGAFVTDGVDDLIVSQKPVSEMLGGSNEITVVSMIHQITKEPDDYTVTNIIKQGSRNYIRNKVKQIYKTGIYGYSLKGNTTSNINILGDKNDYSIEYSMNDVLSGNFSVVGAIMEDNSIVANSSIAYYWTFIANKELTSDQINQVIEYFNLDKYVAPDIYYNIKKQGITNDNHDKFGDKLIDYSGNGHDMQLYNIAWNVESGIGGCREDFTTWYTSNRVPTVELTPTKLVLDRRANACNFGNMGAISIKAMTIKVNGLSSKNYIDYKYFAEPTSNNQLSIRINEDGIYNLPYGSYSKSSSLIIGFFITILSDDKVTIEQLPIGENALVLDGVNDYGKVTNLPILKDYTVVADYQRLDVDKNTGVLSKYNEPNKGAFIFDVVEGSKTSYYSFGTANYKDIFNDRKINYQSKYNSLNGAIGAGASEDSNAMWLGTIRDKDNRFSNLAFYSAMIFPYSLSKFLIERQLKRYKVGSFYEKGAVLFRPLISSNTPYKEIEIYDFTGDKNNGLLLSNSIDKSGTYLPEDNKIAIFIKPNGVDEVSTLIVNGDEYKSSGININGFYQFYVKLTKSPQVIDITIDEYIRFEDIVQPYPIVITEIETIRNTSYHKVTYGGKFRVDTSYKITKAENLLSNLYHINSIKIYKGTNTITADNIDDIKRLWYNFSNTKIISNTTYLLDSNEPKCILSPERLQIPNESLEYLGYIPDISGHGNHGVPVNNAWDSELSGPQEDGSWKLDGVDDFIVINDLSIGGRQMFMKFSYEGYGSLAYDQRNGGTDNFAMCVGDGSIAHNYRNSGDTYIDGILNKNIISSQLQNIIHNATLTNDIDIDVVIQTPVIGSNRSGSNYFTKMSLYTFMLFDEISTPEKIKELNEIMGVNPIVETPPYYIDTHGKTNMDADKAQLVNLGNGGEHTLNIQNVGYEAMSGYGGYTFPNFNYWSVTGGNVLIDVDTETPYHVDITNVNESDQWQWCRYISEGQFTVGGSGKAIFKCDKNIGFIIDLKYRKAGDTVDNTVTLFEQQVKANTPTEISWTYKTQEELDALGAVSHWYLVYFWLAKDVTYSIDMLPEYPNGLVLDGVNDAIINTTIPALTDFTCIVKREAIGERISSSVFMYKGGSDNLLTEEKAFLYNYKNNNGEYIYSFDKYNNLDPVTPISYITPTSTDGRSITRGTGKDTNGLTIGKWSSYWKGVFYKMMLYPKTLDILQINMLKNLFELDEKIDINNPIFKK